MFRIDKFPYWVQHTLPQVYDESLSYYELLTKVMNYLDKVIEQGNSLTDEMESIRAEFETIKEWIETDALTENVLTVLNDWYATGKFQDLINESVFNKYVDDELERYHVHPMKLGAVGDGVSDDTTFLQLAVNMGMSLGVPVNLGNQTYKITSTIVGGSNLHMVGSGATIDYSAIPKDYDVTGVSRNDTIALSIDGSFGEDTFLSQDAFGQSTSIVVGDTTGFSPGDFVQIGSEDFYPYSGRFTIPRGEIKEIRSITGNTITFTTAVYEGYKIVNSAFMRKINFQENVDIEGIRFIGQGVDQLVNNNREVGVSLFLVKNFNIAKCGFYKQDMNGVRLRSSILGNVVYNDIKGQFRVSNASKGTTYYGVIVSNNCQWVYIGQNKGETLRRMGVVTASQTLYGQPYFIIFQGNQFRDSHFGSSGRVEGFEHHGFGRWITFDSNQVDSALGGIRFEGKDIVCTNNIFTNITGNGITFDDDSGWFENILVANNHISEPVDDGTSSTGYGIQIQLSPINENRNIVIRNNVIRGFASTRLHGIRVVAKTGATVRNCHIDDNVIDSGKSVISEDGIGIWIESTGFDVSGNKIYGYDRAMSFGAESDGNLIVGNEISNPQSGVGTDGTITIYGKNIKSIRNIFKNCNIAHRTISSAVNTKIHDNIYIGVNTLLSNVGTGTVETSPQTL